jgi:hypothetical protein|tara:strand:- start:300 stop:1223 length:924 start_codon:yes stop_codon:yes gene_type:complete
MPCVEAVELATQAVRADTEGDVERAVELYSRAVDALDRAASVTPAETAQMNIASADYRARVVILQQQLQVRGEQVRGVSGRVLSSANTFAHRLRTYASTLRSNGNHNAGSGIQTRAQAGVAGGRSRVSLNDSLNMWAAATQMLPVTAHAAVAGAALGGTVGAVGAVGASAYLLTSAVAYNTGQPTSKVARDTIRGANRMAVTAGAMAHDTALGAKNYAAFVANDAACAASAAKRIAEDVAPRAAGSVTAASAVGASAAYAAYNTAARFTSGLQYPSIPRLPSTTRTGRQSDEEGELRDDGEPLRRTD